MLKIYKYELAISRGQNFRLPVDAKVLTAQMQHGALCIWVQLDDRGVCDQLRIFDVYGTGHDMMADSRYIATVQDGSFVWHVYERN